MLIFLHLIHGLAQNYNEDETRISLNFVYLMIINNNIRNYLSIYSEYLENLKPFLLKALKL